MYVCTKHYFQSVYFAFIDGYEYLIYLIKITIYLVFINTVI